jgi:RNA polymerase sigma-70 factor (ECF subfamily)
MNVERDFNEIYDSYAGAVYRLCLRAVSRREVAEDLTSDVFLLFHQNRHKIPDEQLPGWLFTVAKRRAADYWRHHYVEQRWNAARTEEPSSSADPEFSLERLLGRCPNLTDVHRACLILRFRHGMSRAEIAAHTHLSELQVKGHLQYALHLLRLHMERPVAASNPSLSPDSRSAVVPLRKETETLDA